MTRRRVLLVLLAAAVALPTAALSLCRLLPIDCHQTGEQDIFRGLAGTGAGATKLPDGFAQEVVASGFERPTSFALLPDGGILVAEKRGIVWRIAGRGPRRPEADLRSRVSDYGYRGLLAIEPVPPFTRTRALYVLYVQGRGQTRTPTSVRLSRIELGRAGRERVLLGRAGRRSCNGLPRGADCIPCDRDHCGGDVEVAAGGTLFVSTGDGWDGSAGFSQNTLRAQNIDSLGGKLLHLAPDGRGLRTNPYWNGVATSNRSRVWAHGLRNPFRVTLSASGDRVLAGDVGWNAWEEIDSFAAGTNGGWPCYEGPEKPDEYRNHPVCRDLYGRGRDAVRFPVVAYHRGSVTGGVVYAAEAFPARYRGGYFYGDWSRSLLRFLRLGADRAREEDFASGAAGPVQLEVGQDGSLYYLALNTGELRRVVYRG